MNLTPNEVLIICLVALVALGPKRLPQVARQLAKGAAQLRRLNAQIRNEFDAVVDEAVVESHDRELKEQANPEGEPLHPRDSQ